VSEKKEATKENKETFCNEKSTFVNKQASKQAIQNVDVRTILSSHHESVDKDHQFRNRNDPEKDLVA
jgi:hypothetical protein